MSMGAWLGEDPAAVDQGSPVSVFTWATVSQASPLRIRLDGMTDPQPAAPQSLVPVANLTLGKRCWVQIHGRQAIILGTKNGA